MYHSGTDQGLSSTLPKLVLITWCGSDFIDGGILGQCLHHSKKQNCQTCGALAARTCLGSCGLLKVLWGLSCPLPQLSPLHTLSSLRASCGPLHCLLPFVPPSLHLLILQRHVLVVLDPVPCQPCVVGVCLLTAL